MAKVVSGTMKITCRFIHASRLCSKNIVIRKPIRVLNVPSEENIDPITRKILPTLEKGTALPKVVKEKKLPAIIEKPEENVVSFEKLSKYDDRFIKTVTIMKNRKLREKSGKILLEGKRLINDAIKAGMHLRTIYFSREKDLQEIQLQNHEDVEVFRVLYQTLRVWSDLKSCPGVMAVFTRPAADELNVLSQATLPVTVLCDNIRDPGNLGSIIRNAAAAGCANVLLTKGCVDPWEIKVLRAGCGGHFRIPVINDIEWSQISNYIPSSATIFVADNSCDIDAISESSNFINYVDIEDVEEVNEEDEKKYFAIDELGQHVKVDESFNSKTELDKYDIPLPCHLYCGIQYPKENIVLYIGGETHGVDPKVTKLICEYGGKKIKIPMEGGMDSMNSAFAMTVILYEIKRQLTQIYISH